MIPFLKEWDSLLLICKRRWEDGSKVEGRYVPSSKRPTIFSKGNDIAPSRERIQGNRALYADPNRVR